MAKVVLFAVVGLGIVIPSAHAVDWKISATQSETVEVNNNRLMLAIPRGESYNSINQLLFNARALAPGSTFTFNGTIDYRTFGGPGEATTLNSSNNSVKASYEKVAKQTTYNAYLSRVETDTSTLQLLETGQATLTGITVINSAGGGFKHLLSPRDTLSSQTVFTQTNTSRTSSGATTTTAAAQNSTFSSLISSLELQHNVNSITDWLPSLQFQQLNFGGVAPSTTLFWRATSGFQTQLTRNVTMKTSAGGTALNSGQSTTAVAGAARNTSQPSAAFDWIADVVLTYKHRAGSVVFTAAESNGPTSLGLFVKTRTVGISANYSIDQASSVTTSTSFSELTSATSTSDVVTAQATYSRTLMRDLESQLTYRHIQRTSLTTTAAAAAIGTLSTKAQSDAVLVVLRRNVTILP